MRVLIATGRGQGQRRNDFNHCDPAELVMVPLIACDEAAADDHCGCARQWIGLATRKGTTTAQVADLPMTEAEYERMILASLLNAGWVLAGEEAEGAALARQLADRMRAIAAAYLTGDVLEFRDGIYGRRFVNAEAEQ